MSYTKNEIALETFISNTNNQFYYIGEEDDKVAPIDVKKFTEYCVAFIDSLEIEKLVTTQNTTMHFTLSLKMMNFMKYGILWREQ